MKWECPRCKKPQIELCVKEGYPTLCYKCLYDGKQHNPDAEGYESIFATEPVEGICNTCGGDKLIFYLEGNHPLGLRVKDCPDCKGD